MNAPAFLHLSDGQSKSLDDPVETKSHLATAPPFPALVLGAHTQKTSVYFEETHPKLSWTSLFPLQTH